MGCARLCARRRSDVRPPREVRAPPARRCLRRLLCALLPDHATPDAGESHVEAGHLEGQGGEDRRRTKKMLAIDGGGIRGILPAMMLAELARRAQPPVGALFDLLAGTSTGGILALGLTVPGEPGKPKDRAADLVGLYAQEGRTLCARSVWHRVRSVGGVAEEKYPSEGIEATLARSVGEARRASASDQRA